jgi:hypothetical protein
MSGEAARALVDRLATFRATGDPAVLLDGRALVEAAALRSSLGWPAAGPLPAGAEIRSRLDAIVTIGTFRWQRSQVLPQADRLDDLVEAIELLTAARSVAPRSVPRPLARTLAAISGQARRADYATVHDEAIDALSTGTRTGRLSAVDHAIVLLSGVARAAAGDPAEPYYLSDLGTAWLNRFRITGRSRDLDNCLAAHERALAAPVPVPVPEVQAALLANHGAALLARFAEGGNLRHLDQAVVTARMAADLARAAGGPGAAGGAGVAGGQGVAGGPETVVVPGPADERAAGIRLAQLASLSQLSAALLASFELRGSEADLDEAVQAAQEAADLAPAGDPAHPRYHASLARLLSAQAAQRTRSGAAGSAADIA